MIQWRPERPGVWWLYHILSHFVAPTNDEVITTFTSVFQIRKLILWEVVICPRSQSLRDRARIWTQEVWSQSTWCSEPISLPWFPTSYQSLPIHLPEPLPRSMALLWGRGLGAAQGSQYHPSLTSLVSTLYPGFALFSLSPCQSDVFLLKLTLC